MCPMQKFVWMLPVESEILMNLIDQEYLNNTGH